jgi:hypothetical protein
VFAPNLMTKVLDSKAQALNIIGIAQTLWKNPQRTQELFSLYSGVNRSSEQILPDGIIDKGKGRIEKIASYNSFGMKQGSSTNSFSSNDLADNSASDLWIFPRLSTIHVFQILGALCMVILW